MNRCTAAALAAVVLAPVAARAADETVETIETRPGITMGMIVTPPPGPPVASAILFAGGEGRLGLWRGDGTRSGNFLVRSRGRFAGAGVLAVTVDVPSDRRADGLVDFRGSAAHRADISAVIRWVRARTPAPLWLIGTSRGTISAAHLAAAGLAVDGVVLSATVTGESRRRPATAVDADLAAIRVPVLLVHHRDDACRVTPVEGLAVLRGGLRNAPRVETLLFEGGDAARSDPCQAQSAHGFFGIGDRVVAAIVRWMVANGPKR